MKCILHYVDKNSIITDSKLFKLICLYLEIKRIVLNDNIEENTLFILDKDKNGNEYFDTPDGPFESTDNVFAWNNFFILARGFSPDGWTDGGVMYVDKMVNAIEAFIYHTSQYTAPMYFIDLSDKAKQRISQLYSMLDVLYDCIVTGHTDQLKITEIIGNNKI